MKYSQLAPFLIVLLNAFGEVGPEGLTDFQEDCAGDGALTSGVRHWGFRANRRDATWFDCSVQPILPRKKNNKQ